jgi:hypothetical protein
MNKNVVIVSMWLAVAVATVCDPGAGFFMAIVAGIVTVKMID